MHVVIPFNPSRFLAFRSTPFHFLPPRPHSSLMNPEVVLFFAQQGTQITKVAAGREHSVACTDAGTVFSWGWGEAGRLGLGAEMAKVLYPTCVKSLLDAGECVVTAACGREHTLLATSTGSLYACGTGFGLGLGDAEMDEDPYSPSPSVAGRGSPLSPGKKHEPHAGEVLTPRLVMGELLGEEVVGIGAGDAHSLAVTSTGLVFSWGFGGSGALGHGAMESQSAPRLVSALVEHNQSILNVDCGEYHSAAVSREGHLWIWGDGEAGQLGLADLGGPEHKLLYPHCLNPSAALRERSMSMMMHGGYNVYGGARSNRSRVSPAKKPTGAPDWDTGEEGPPPPSRVGVGEPAGVGGADHNGRVGKGKRPPPMPPPQGVLEGKEAVARRLTSQHLLQEQSDASEPQSDASEPPLPPPRHIGEPNVSKATPAAAAAAAAVVGLGKIGGSGGTGAANDQVRP
jgi:hypothetical protein